jgi:hypothetical protein
MDEAVGSDGKPFPHSIDAKFWAEEFVKVHGGNMELMHAWFANALMAGYDEAQRRYEPDAQRYLFLAAHYGRSRDLHMDGSSRWYVTTPYLSRGSTLSLGEAIDAARAEQDADAR